MAINIQVSPVAAITPSFSNGVSITPSPIGTQTIDPTNASFMIVDIDSVPTATVNIPGVGMAGIGVASSDSGGIPSDGAPTVIVDDIVISVGVATQTLSPFALNSFIYTFENFTLSSPGAFIAGDVVYFTASGSNSYSSDLANAQTQTKEQGAIQGCWIFMSYNGTDLVLMQKGYFDFTSESPNFGEWKAGYTLYLNGDGRLDINPSTGSGNWVKSFGHCVPNTENKKRIWFDPDSTYLKIS
jgi:hypothetical protein